MTVPKIIYRVFVSSTYEDLREERAEVQKALLKLNCFPVGMEIFPSADEETWAFIRRQIDDCDYYIAIVAGRYGSLANDGVSFTEKEYDYAREIGKPLLSFVHADPDALPVSKTERDESARRRLATFLEKVKRFPINTFRSPHELSRDVVASLVDLKDTHPVPGYIRADQVADWEKYAALLEENARLKSQLRELASDIPFRAAAEVRWVTTSAKLPKTEEWQTQELSITWGQIFLHVAEVLLEGDSTAGNLGSGVAQRLMPTVDRAASVKIVEFDGILKKLFGWGLVDFYVQERITMNRFSHTIQYWRLTEYGQKQYGVISDGKQNG